MLERWDMDGDGEIDFDEFVFMMARQQQHRKDPEDDIAEAFSILDEDGDGFLYPHELKRVGSDILFSYSIFLRSYFIFFPFPPKKPSENTASGICRIVLG